MLCDIFIVVGDRILGKAHYAHIVTILCFLHVFIKLRDGGKRKCKEVFEAIATKLWEAYDATNKRSFSQRVRRLVEEASTRNIDRDGSIVRADVSCLLLKLAVGIDEGLRPI